MDLKPSENPRAINVASFATARAHEINTMMSAIKVVGGTRLAFQRLPRHMQRRAMSHNIKRLPKRLRDVARRQAQWNKQHVKKKKSDDDGTSQHPKKSRFHRRRPGNLREEYARRQKRIRWLETHIWHAKRFKMVEQWGWKIPLHPSDKSARAAYRATARHCVLSDISFLQVVELGGEEANIIQAMKHFTSPEIGLTMASKAFLSGTRHGQVILYRKDKYPSDVMGPVDYLWQVEEDSSDGNEGDEMETNKDAQMKDRRLWLWIHPSCWSEVLNELNAVVPQYHVSVTSLENKLLRFRLQGPLAHPILLDALQVAMVPPRHEDKEEHPKYWWENYYEGLNRYQTHEEQAATWKDLQEIQSIAELSTNTVISLTVRDPRVILPKKRTKIMANPDNLPDVPRQKSTHNLPKELSASPLWSPDVRRAVADEQRPHYELNELRSKLLVPGTNLHLGRDESRVPVLLLQQPGARAHVGTGTGMEREGSCMLGYGGGWDLVVPRKWGMAFWVGLVFRGARAVGLREAGKIALHRSLPRFPHDFPDSESGRYLMEKVAEDREVTFSRKPPAKRPNHPKLGIAAPFLPPWTRLITEWVSKQVEDQSSCEQDKGDGTESCPEWYVLRNRQKLQAIQKELQCLTLKRAKSRTDGASVSRKSVKGMSRTLSKDQGKDQTVRKGLENQEQGHRGSSTLNRVLLPSECRTLVWVGLRMVGRGFPSEFAIICLPDSSDQKAFMQDPTFGGPVEPLHKEFTRKRLRKLENGGKCSKSKKAKVVKKSDPVPPSTPADFGYTSGKQMDTSESSECGDSKGSKKSPDDAGRSETRSSCPENDAGGVKQSSTVTTTQVVTKGHRTGNDVRTSNGESSVEVKAKESQGGGISDAGQTVNGSAKGKQEHGQGVQNSQRETSRQSILALFPHLLESCSRELIGFVTNGAQAFSVGVGMGTGFVATPGLLKLVNTSPQGRKPVVLVRDTQSLQYRFAYIYVPQ